MARDTSPGRNRPYVPNRQLSDTLAFMRLLWRVDHGLRSMSKRMQARLGITAPQRLALRIIGKFSKLTPSELAELMYLDRGTLSGVVERLSAQNLVRREPHALDGRSLTLQLTEEGQNFARLTAGTVEASVRRALSRLSQSKVAIASEVLDAIAAELEREEHTNGSAPLLVR